MNIFIPSGAIGVILKSNTSFNRVLAYIVLLSMEGWSNFTVVWLVNNPAVSSNDNCHISIEQLSVEVMICV